MMKYTIVTAKCETTLVRLVQEHINDFWTPIGGISVTWTNNGTLFAQAMTRDYPGSN